MSILTEIAARISAQTAISQVNVSVDFTQAQRASLAETEVWVVPMDEAAEDNSRTLPGVIQPVTLTVGIVMKVRMPGDVSGEQALAALDPDLVAIREALLGWTPASADEPLTYAGGNLMGIKETEVWWLAQYRTMYLISTSGV